MVEHVIKRNLLVGLILVRLENIEPLAALHLCAHLMKVEPVGAVLVVAAIARGDLVVVVNEYRARHAPIRYLYLGAGLGLAFAVILPMGFEMLREQEIGGEGMKVALSHQHHAGGEWRYDGADNLRPWLLIGLAHIADAEIPRHGARG